jgi:hypothetical protein
LTILANSALVLALFTLALFAVAMLVNNNGVADVGYDIAIAATATKVAPLSITRNLIASLPIVWGLRSRLAPLLGELVCNLRFLQIYMLLILVYPASRGIGQVTIAGVFAWVISSWDAYKQKRPCCPDHRPLDPAVPIMPWAIR